MAQAGLRRSTRLDAKKQAKAIPHFDSLPQLVLTAIHDTLLHGSNNEDGFCTYIARKDAACFRSTCKAFYDVAIIPPVLKIAFVEPPSQQTMDSLALMLSKPIADHTQLSLQLFMQCSEQPHSDHIPVIGAEAHQPWALPLEAVANRVVRLEIPSVYINASLAAAVKALPGLRDLVLHVGSVTETGYLYNDIGNGVEESEDGVPAWLNLSQLETLTLSVPPGTSPFCFLSWEDEPPLDLKRLPNFKHLVLRGPIVKDGFDEEEPVPFMLPLQAKVTIDAGLDGRKPTPWARPFTVYERFDALPGAAVPDELQYKEEDDAAYRTGLSNFSDRVYKEALKQAPSIDDCFGCFKAFVEGFLCDDHLESVMRSEGIEGRPSLLPVILSVRHVAADAIRAFRESFRGFNEGDGNLSD